jgi:hypothetical protein
MAITAMLNSDPSPNAEIARRHISSLDSRQRVDYPPLNNLSGSGAGGPAVPSSYPSRTGSYSPVAGAKSSLPPSQSQPVYYPPVSVDVPFQHYSTANTATAAAVQGIVAQQQQQRLQQQQQQQQPNFAQMVSSSRTSDPATAALLARQASSNASPELNVNNYDRQKAEMEKLQRLQKEKNMTASSTSSSSSEVVMREKVLKISNQRASSLKTPSSPSSASPVTYTRQSSRSMDLTSLKWRCRTCTMENGATDKICSACSRSRDAPEVEYPTAGESKRCCPTCTFENPPSNTSCELCMCILPQDVHTYV